MQRRRTIAWVLLSIMVGDMLLPFTALALTSGPTQPEVQSFTPVSASDMVDLFSGDFSYNVPLLDVEGYPVNLFYQGGISMDQEASWVGLGWNLNPGSVNRNLRGLPDDFNGDQLTRDMYMRPNRSFSLTRGASFEIVGSEEGAGTISETIGLQLSNSSTIIFNNYNGMSFENTVGGGFSLKSSKESKSSFTAGLGLTSGSHTGLTIQPEVGIDAWENKQGEKMSFGVGISMNSRKGLTELTLDASATLRRQSKRGSKLQGMSLASTSFDIGQPTYTPQLSMPMRDLSFSFNVSIGTDAFLLNPSSRTRAFFSTQHLREPRIMTPAYGYLHLDQGQTGGNVALDFNRERGGPFTPDQAALGLASLTPDVFSVSGHGVSGSYRAFRSEVGHVHDQAVSSGGFAGSFGAELGTGNLAHAGLDIKVNSSSSWSGRWSQFNVLVGKTRFRSSTGSRETVAFRSASEPVVLSDDELFHAFGGNEAYRPKLFRVGSYDGGVESAIERTEGAATYTKQLPQNTRLTQRYPRAQTFQYLTRKEVAAGLGLEPLVQPAWLSGGDGHMAEVTILDQTGQRFVYGLPVYNIVQEDVTFAIDGADALPQEAELIPYQHGVDNSVNNRNGQDHFYSRSITPSYAHAFMLTAIVSADYADVDGIRGPTPGDLGTFTRFKYTKNVYHSGSGGDHYLWRTPIGADQARLDRGLGATDSDDKASYVAGRKELWYLERIESPNRVAIFELNDPTGPASNGDAMEGARLDGYGVSESGSPLSSCYQRFLKRISLYDRNTYEAYERAVQEAIDSNEDPALIPLPEPLKQVHLSYDYSLCPGTPNSAGGKLTLKRVWFTYGRSKAGALAPYVFDYGDTQNVVNNPPYDMGAQDRWGNVKPDKGSVLAAQFGTGDFLDLPNNVFPYTEQNGSATNDLAGAWTLKRVRLPSGAELRVEFEADDYAFVQNRKATRMMRLAHAAHDTEQPTWIDANSTVQDLKEKKKLYVKLPAEVTSLSLGNEYMEAACSGMKELYFRTKVFYDWKSFQISDGWDYVSGYAQIESFGAVTIGPAVWGFIILKGVHLDECNVCLDDDDNSPLYRAAIQHARINYPRQLYSPQGMSDELALVDLVWWIPDQHTMFLDLLNGLLNYFIGPNKEVVSLNNMYLDSPGRRMRMKMGDSFVKLYDPSARKLGGGHRVRRVEVYDRWNEMEGAASSASYIEEYTYGDDKGSWGVASYEPMIGADENPFRVPVTYDVDNALAADERFYQEEPFGESLFPAARVGYARVEVAQRAGGSYDGQGLAGTGKVVHQFFTARDFPTKPSYTSIRPINHPTPGVAGILGITATDHMHVSQGFSVETNDMHGKMKSMEVYAAAEGQQQAALVSSVTYHYKIGPGGHLSDQATVITPGGTVEQATIGRNLEILMDLREYGSTATSIGVQANLEVFMAGPVPGALPPIIPQYSSESTRFRSAVMVKHIDRFGQLEKIVKVDRGAVQTVENLAYDAVTGKVLLTRTSNEYGDGLYALQQPAYWYHDAMGPAYRNVGAILNVTLDATGTGADPQVGSCFVLGDEVSLTRVVPGQPFTIVGKGWVVGLTSSTVRVVNEHGLPVAPAGAYLIKVLRSGRRNLQNLDMATLETASDPLHALPSNVFSNVLKASAAEYSDVWRKDCACSPLAENVPGNAYADNRRGVWRVVRERVWLTDRVRSMVNGNTNIRHDGVYGSFAPFYKLQNGSWTKDERGWTVAREMVDYSVRSQVLEERDALGLYSSATFAHAGQLPNTVAANAQHQEVGFDSFEAEANCADQHFRFDKGEAAVVEDRSHSGRRSIRVPSGQQARFMGVLRGCEEPPPCPLLATVTPITGGFDVSFTQGTPPYDLSGSVSLSGSPSVTLLPEGVRLTGQGTWSYGLVVRDATGCERAVTIP